MTGKGAGNGPVPGGAVDGEGAMSVTRAFVPPGAERPERARAPKIRRAPRGSRLPRWAPGSSSNGRM